ncbi:DsbA family oxidoreductase [Symbiobacterium terraclitae]|uniref:DsbA family oxidoreductase n=1 Tax=Symbiobacterium terraclitae TaxID=557451 RepID=UPI001AE8B056
MGEGLVERLRREPDLDLTVTWLPFELHPDTPQEGVSLLQKLGHLSAPQLEMMMAELRQRAAGLGLPFNPPPTLFNTRRALQLAEFGRDRGRLDHLHRPLFQAYFVDGANLSDEGVLRRVAEAAGLDADAGLAAVREGRYARRLADAAAEADRYGVRAVPTFIINDRYKVVGAQPYEKLREILRTVAREG